MSIFKDWIRSALYRSGGVGLWHRWRNRDVLTVLMFHRVLPDNDPAFDGADREFTFSLDGFSRTLDFVQRHYNVIDLKGLSDSIDGGGSLPANPLLLTFDDGWRDTLIHAAPELEHRGLSAVMFLATEVVDLPGQRWWQDVLASAFTRTGAVQRLMDAGGLQGCPDRESPPQVVAAHLAQFPEAKRWDWLHHHVPEVAAQTVPTRQMVNLADLRARNPEVIRVGGHGHTHAPLTAAAEPWAELRKSQRFVQANEAGPLSMSFPHGCFSADLVQQAHAVGFQWVFTSEPVLEKCAEDGQTSGRLGRIHLPENEWTCSHGKIDPAKLATYLFLRPTRQRTGS